MPTPAYGAEWTPRCTVKSGSLSKELSQPEFFQAASLQIGVPSRLCPKGAGKVRTAQEMDEGHRPGRGRARQDHWAGLRSPPQYEFCDFCPAPQPHGYPIVGCTRANVHERSLAYLVKSSKERVQEIGRDIPGEDLPCMSVPGKDQVYIWPSLEGSLGSQRLMSQ